LQACPTYLALEDENDSPRGRLVLMRALVDGDVSLDDRAVATHIDRCLGCRGCESACPSGVPYGQLLEATREALAARRSPPWIARLVLRVFRSRALVTVALGMGRVLRALRASALLRHVGGRAGFAFAMLEASRRPRLASSQDPRPALKAASGERGPTVALLEGCVMRTLYAETNRATVRVLARNEYHPVPTPPQTCCGALHAHAGDADGARAQARTNIVAFEASGAEFIAVNSAGCGAMMKEYGHLLREDPSWRARAERVAARVRDVSELLAAANQGRGPSPGGPLPCRVAYDAPCHLQHAQRVTRQPLDVLRNIPDLSLTLLRDADQCCGAAGLYTLVEPATSAAVLRPKLAAVEESGAQFVATGNPGCLMQIGAALIQSGSAVRAVHPVDLLDASYLASVNP
jgi:glycolate oxidase iron-sulfur subunit